MVTHNTKDAPNLILSIIKFHSSFSYNCDCLLCLFLLCLIVDQNKKVFLLQMTTATHCKELQQAEMIRTSTVSTSPSPSPSPGPTKPMTLLTSHTSGSKTIQPFLSQHNDLLDEPVLESTETLLDQERLILLHLHLFNLLSILLEGSKDLPEFTFTFMTIILHLISHLKMLINL